MRYGVRQADDKYVVNTIAEYDSQALPENLKVKYNFSFESSFLI